MVPEYDVAVIGAGPAGCAAARELARCGARVLLLEAKKIPRYKPCAGGLTRKTLRLLGTLSPSVSCQRVEELVVTYKGKTVAVVNCQLAVVKRLAFDAWLVEQAARAGAEFREGEQVLSVAGDRVETSRGVYRARVIVGADGANSVVARSAGLGLAPRGIAVETPVSWRKPGEKVLVELGFPPCGYAWIFPHSDGTASAGVISWRLGLPLRSYLVAFLERYRLRALQNPRGWPVPQGGRKRQIVRGNVLLVGDAAGLADPFSGEGIYYALRSGLLAAEVILKHLVGGAELANYQRRVAALLLPMLASSRRLAGIFYPAPLLLQRLLVFLGCRCLPGLLHLL